MAQPLRLANLEIDWQPVRERIAQAAVAIEQAERPSPERARAVLEERALRLAVAPAGERAATATIEVLSFTLGNENYAIETRFTLEVMQGAGLTQVPGVPDFVAGVTNLRGEILPVFDLRRLFGMVLSGNALDSKAIVLGESRPEFAILADSVDEVIPVPTNTLLPGPLFEKNKEDVCTRGVTHTATIILDGAALLADRRLFIDGSRTG